MKTAVQSLPLTRREFVETQRAMQDAVAPIVAEQVRIHCLATPTYNLSADGSITQTSDGLSDPLRERLRALESMHAQVAAPYLERLNRGVREY